MLALTISPPFATAPPAEKNQPDATAEVIQNGWLDAGDVMSVDALLAHPAVVAAGVVGIHNLAHAENVRAYVTLQSGAPQPTASELIVFARNSIGYKAPEEVIFPNEMPLSPAGKTDRTTLKKMAEAAAIT